jgi:hypothetical protein
LSTGAALAVMLEKHELGAVTPEKGSEQEMLA